MVSTIQAGPGHDESRAAAPLAARRRARLFDGRSTDGQAAATWIEGQDLLVEVLAPAGASPEPRCTRHPLRTLGLGDRWQSGPYPVSLSDGGTLWIDGDDPAWAGFVDALLQGAGRRLGAQRLWCSWPAALACLALLVAVLVWIDRQGAGLAARAVLPLVPLKVDEVVGAQALKSLDASLLERSGRDGDIDGLRRRFHDMARACGQGRSFRFEVRQLREEPGFNAFALPDGTLVVLDGLLAAFSEDEVLAVLGHEIGHVVHRHTMDHLLKSLGLLAAAGVVFSDFSSVLATGVGTVQFLRHSRAAEREADAHARECLARAGIEPRVMLGVWTKFRAETDRRGGAEPPGWLSTHPGLEERLRAARQP